MVKKSALLVTAAVAATAAVGSIASAETRAGWYQRLEKPWFQPPARVFPAVWSSLYGSMAWALTRAFEAAPANDRGALTRTTGTNLVLNAGWSWVFFKAHRPGPATLWAGLLALSSWRLAARAGRADAAAGRALIPYGLWTTFATVLSARLWQLNPRAHEQD